MDEARSRRLRLLAAALVVAVHAAVVWAAFRGLPRYSDEVHHLRQIAAFCAGDLSVDPKLTTIPGYHALSALAGRLAGDCSLPTMRAVDLVFGLLSVVAFYAAATVSGVGRPVVRALQYWFLPVLVPYHFLVYTDSIALLALLAAVALLLRGRSVAAGAAFTASILLRQTNVVWLVLLGVLALADDDGRRGWRRLLPFAPGLVAFFAFVAWNGGIAMGDQRAHQAGLHLGNVFFFLMLFFLLFLPRNVSVLWAQRERLLGGRLGVVVAVAGVVFVLTFGVAHAYNRFPGFLRNDLLMLLDERPLLRVAAFVPVAGAIAVMAGDRLRRASFHALYAVTLLSLVPLKLVDHRYDLAPLALFLLFRKDDAPGVEAASLLWAIVLSSVLLDGIARGAFAL